MAIFKSHKVETEEPKEVSKLNCTNCKGEGLVKNDVNVDERCTTCAGTGKVE